MDPIFIAMLAKFGIDTVTTIIKSWNDSGNPTKEQIQEAFITKKPEDYFKS